MRVERTGERRFYAGERVLRHLPIQRGGASWNCCVRGNCTAGELAEHFDISKPSLSHHLATLKNAGLVTDERHGQNIVYSLNTTVMQDLIGWFMGFTNTEGDKDE